MSVSSTILTRLVRKAPNLLLGGDDNERGRICQPRAEPDKGGCCRRHQSCPCAFLPPSPLLPPSLVSERRLMALAKMIISSSSNCGSMSTSRLRAPMYYSKCDIVIHIWLRPMITDWLILAHYKLIICICICICIWTTHPLREVTTDLLPLPNSAFVSPSSDPIKNCKTVV